MVWELQDITRVSFMEKTAMKNNGLLLLVLLVTLSWS